MHLISNNRNNILYMIIYSLFINILSTQELRITEEQNSLLLNYIPYVLTNNCQRITISQNNNILILLLNEHTFKNIEDLNQFMF